MIPFTRVADLNSGHENALAFERQDLGVRYIVHIPKRHLHRPRVVHEYGTAVEKRVGFEGAADID